MTKSNAALPASNKRLPKMRKSRTIKRSFASALIGIIIVLFCWAGQELTAVRMPQAEHPAELYSNQTRDDLKRIHLTAINSAKESILLIVYTLSDSQIIEALRQKADQGIDVRVICDAKASPQSKKRLGQKVDTLKRSAPGLMHQKILVIDKKDCWIGSANMTSESLRMHGNLVVAMHHPDIAEMIIAKSLGMEQKGRADPYPHREFLLGDQEVSLWFLPDNPDAIFRLRRMIDSATKTLRIAMFTWTHPVLTKAVIDAHERGIDVEVAIDHYSGKGASAEVVKRLADAGIPTRLSPGGALLHHKFMYLDSNTLVNGSANWTRAAFTQNDDCFIILNNLTQEQHTRMEDLWKTIWNESVEL